MSFGLIRSIDSSPHGLHWSDMSKGLEAILVKTHLVFFGLVASSECDGAEKPSLFNTIPLQKELI